MKCKLHKSRLVELWPGVWECEFCFQEGVSLKLTVLGTTPSGKNAVVVTRSGHRFPNARFTKWRTDALVQINKQVKAFINRNMIDSPVNCIVRYWAKDKIRRDAPGIQDAVWHLLERAGIVKDDRWLGGEGKKSLFYFKGVDKKNPRIEIYLC